MTLKDNIQNPVKSDYKRYRFIRDYVFNEFDTESTALEIGADDGTFAQLLVFLGLEVTTIDIANHDFDWKHHVMDIQSSHLDEQFDIVFLCQVLEHLRHPRRAIKNALRMCKPGGVLCVSVPDFEAEGHLRTYSEKSLDKLVSRYAEIFERKTFERTHPDPTKKITRQHLVLARRK